MTTIFENNNLVTLDQAAEMMGITLSTFRQHYTSRFDDVKVKIGRRVYIPKDALNRILPSANISSN